MDDKKPTTKKTTKKKASSSKKPQDAPEAIDPPVGVDVATGIETVAPATDGGQDEPKTPGPENFTPSDMVNINESDPENESNRMKSAPAKAQNVPAKSDQAVRTMAPPIPKPTGAPNPAPVSAQVKSSQMVAPPLPDTPALRNQRARANRTAHPPAANSNGGYIEQRIAILERENADLKKSIATLNRRMTAVTGAIADLGQENK